MDNDFLSWFAGFIDGEGCIFLRRLKRHGVWASYQAGMQISNTNKDVLTYIQSKVGEGTIRFYTARTVKSNPYYVYGIYDRKCLVVCRAVVDKLKIKGIQAKTVIEFYDTTFPSLGGHRVSEEVILQRDRLVNIMSGVNSRGREVTE